MNILIPKSIPSYKKRVEHLAGKRISIKDYKGIAYFDGNQTIYVNLNLSPEVLEEKLFHELTHANFKYSGFPVLQPKGSARLANYEMQTVSFPEEIMVDKFLADKHLPFNDHFYESGFYKVTTSIDAANPLDKPECARHDLRYIRLLIDNRHTGSNITKLKNRYISISGVKKWEFISRISEKLKNIMSNTSSDKDKLFKMFTCMITEYNLNDKIEVVARDK